MGFASGRLQRPTNRQKTLLKDKQHIRSIFVRGSRAVDLGLKSKPGLSVAGGPDVRVVVMR